MFAFYNMPKIDITPNNNVKRYTYKHKCVVLNGNQYYLDDFVSLSFLNTHRCYVHHKWNGARTKTETLIPINNFLSGLLEMGTTVDYADLQYELISTPMTLNGLVHKMLLPNIGSVAKRTNLTRSREPRNLSRTATALLEMKLAASLGSDEP